MWLVLILQVALLLFGINKQSEIPHEFVYCDEFITIIIIVWKKRSQKDLWLILKSGFPVKYKPWFLFGQQKQEAEVSWFCGPNKNQCYNPKTWSFFSFLFCLLFPQAKFMNFLVFQGTKACIHMFFRKGFNHLINFLLGTVDKEEVSGFNSSKLDAKHFVDWICTKKNLKYKSSFFSWKWNIIYLGFAAHM